MKTMRNLHNWRLWHPKELAIMFSPVFDVVIMKDHETAWKHLGNAITTNHACFLLVAAMPLLLIDPPNLTTREALLSLLEHRIHKDNIVVHSHPKCWILTLSRERQHHQERVEAFLKVVQHEVGSIPHATFLTWSARHHFVRRHSSAVGSWPSDPPDSTDLSDTDLLDETSNVYRRHQNPWHIYPAIGCSRSDSWIVVQSCSPTIAWCHTVAWSWPIPFPAVDFGTPRYWRTSEWQMIQKWLSCFFTPIKHGLFVHPRDVKGFKITFPEYPHGKPFHNALQQLKQDKIPNTDMVLYAELPKPIVTTVDPCKLVDLILKVKTHVHTRNQAWHTHHHVWPSAR